MWVCQVTVSVDLGRSKSLNFSCCRMVFDYWGFMKMNIKKLCEYKDDYLLSQNLEDPL